ncbi:MAG TPA: protein kinase [Pseudomonadota bacterium]|nr:protein kinase [Pseudomonadota bacterium]
MSTPGQQDPLIGKVLADRFEILSRIGEGGTGVVYKAKQVTVDRTVAIKVLGAHVSSDPQWVKRFHNEARAAARLDHPNTVRMIDFGETKDGLLFIAMEFLHGRPLSDEISRLGKIPPQRALRIISQVCQSLQEAHGQGIIHRDIKPDNVFLVEMKGQGDFVKVLDFSVAKMDTPDAQLTRAGTVFGTPAYMSPEQARGVKLAPQSDVYACGIVLYEMLTGKPPFEAALPMEVVMMHLRQKPAPLVGFAEPIVRITMKALEKTPDRRQQSADELHRECMDCLDTLFPKQTPSAGMSAVGAQGSASPTVPPQNLPSAGPNQAGASLVGANSPRASSGPPPMAASSGPPPMTAPGSGPPPMTVPSGPPLAPPQGSQFGGSAAPPVATGAEQRTMLATPAPQFPPNMGGGAPANRPGRTVGMDGGHATIFTGGPAGGMTLSAQALVVRQQVLAEKPRRAVSPVPKPLFWVGWALLGMSFGFLLHILWN